MTAAGLDAARSGLWTSLASLLASSSTLICCAIPALLVALGAGATLAWHLGIETPVSRFDDAFFD